MSEDYDTIMLYITQVSNVDRIHELYYLVDKHQEVIIASDIKLKKRKDSLSENPLWLIIENNGRGIYLASKIYKKFKPWVVMGIVKTIYFHDFPKELKEKEKWIPKRDQKLMKIKLTK